MKKIIKFIFPILFIILCACSPKNYFTEVNYKDVIENIDNKESFVLVIGRDDCPYCIDLIENIKYIKTGLSILSSDRVKSIRTVYKGGLSNVCFKKKKILYLHSNI